MLSRILEIHGIEKSLSEKIVADFVLFSQKKPKKHSISYDESCDSVWDILNKNYDFSAPKKEWRFVLVSSLICDEIQDKGISPTSIGMMLSKKSLKKRRSSKGTQIFMPPLK